MFEGGWRGDTIDAMATAAEAAKTHRRRPVVYSYAYGPGLLANSGLPTGSPPPPLQQMFLSSPPPSPHTYCNPLV